MCSLRVIYGLISTVVDQHPLAIWGRGQNEVGVALLLSVKIVNIYV
jgi:hypothetical protein